MSAPNVQPVFQTEMHNLLSKRHSPSRNAHFVCQWAERCSAELERAFCDVPSEGENKALKACCTNLISKDSISFSFFLKDILNAEICTCPNAAVETECRRKHVAGASMLEFLNM